MTEKIVPRSGKDAELLESLKRIADGIETLGRVGLNVSSSIQDQTSMVCATIAESVHALTQATRDNKPTTTRRKATKRAKPSRRA